MKICVGCGIEKDLSEFHKNKKYKDGLFTSCKSCKNIYFRQYYKRRRKELIETVRLRSQRYISEYHEFKKSLVCERCGFSNSDALDFHHIDPNEKDAALSEMLGKWSLARMKEEAKKCEVLCANCHRIEHRKISQDIAEGRARLQGVAGAVQLRSPVPCLPSEGRSKLIP